MATTHPVNRKDHTIVWIVLAVIIASLLAYMVAYSDRGQGVSTNATNDVVHTPATSTE